ncbi:acyltransferase family protein [Dechloromonas sp. ARDL1]|uniref:acyltransferase family protein n=1 Tax=Dechloromonas sp. ARDL1 TaxID=3322121 RepID=UPI003DA6DC78
MLRYQFDTSLVRFLAIVLITNSHLDLLYSDPRFATGGSLGNALFFALSGFGLALSSNKHLPKFGSWIGRRLLRIYPQVIVVLLVGGLITSTPSWWLLEEVIQQFIWPTPYWFVAAIVVFYAPFYLVLRFVPAHIPILLALSAIPYLWFYFTALELDRWAVEGEYFRWLFYFPMMLFGAYLASTPALLEHKLRDAILLILIIASYFGLKVMLNRGLFGEWQLILHLLTFPFVFYAFRLLAHPQVLAALKQWRLYFWIALLGELSLEVYLVQVYWIKALSSSGLVFPVGALLVWPLVFISAWALSIVCRRFIGRFARQSIAGQAEISPELASGEQT